jgi:hypothetical protein
MSDEILRPPVKVTLNMSADIYEELETQAQTSGISMPQLFWEGIRLYRQQIADTDNAPAPGLAPIVRIDTNTASR